MALRHAPFVLSVALTICVGLSSATSLCAEPVADFYKGKTITLVVSSSAGGGFDVIARLVGRFLTRHIPGAPSIVVRDMPGAGGIVAMKYLYDVAPHDGTVLGALVNTTPFEPLFGNKNATFDPNRSHWLGSPGPEIGTLAVWAGSPTKSLEDARRRETTIGAAGITSTPSFYARLINAVLGTKLKIVTGYAGQAEIFLAMERGEVEGHPSVLYKGLNGTRPTWISQKKVNFLVQYGGEREPELGDTPFLTDVIRPEDRSLSMAALAPLAVGRPYFTPPGTPLERVAALRKALAATFADPDFRAEAARLQLGFTTAVSGESMQHQIADAYKIPPDVAARLSALAQL